VAHGIGREEPAGGGHPSGPGAEESLSVVPSSLEDSETRLQRGWLNCMGVVLGKLQEQHRGLRKASTKRLED
jgi:hypothetical protein